MDEKYLKTLLMSMISALILLLEMSVRMHEDNLSSNDKRDIDEIIEKFNVIQNQLLEL